jgi:hypothetical protein
MGVPVMSLASTVRNAVAIANKVTKSLQDSTITITPWIGSDVYGAPLFGSPILVSGIVEERQYLRRLGNGQEVVQRASITILKPMTDNGAAERREPVDPRDKVVLPSGYTGPILDVMGITDPSTHNPYMIEILLGLNV